MAFPTETDMRTIGWQLVQLLKAPPAPTVKPGSGSNTTGDGTDVEVGAHVYAYTWVTAQGESQLSPIHVVRVLDTTNDVVPLTGIAVGPDGTTARKVYRTAADGSAFKLLTTISNNTATTFTDDKPDTDLGAAPLAPPIVPDLGYSTQVNDASRDGTLRLKSAGGTMISVNITESVVTVRSAPPYPS